MMSHILSNINKKTEYSSKVNEIICSEIDKHDLISDIEFLLNNNIISHDDLVCKLFQFNKVDNFKILLENKIIGFDLSLTTKLLEIYSQETKINFINIILNNISDFELIELCNFVIYFNDSNEEIFELVLKKILDKKDDKIIKDLINFCCSRNKLTYLTIILEKTKIKLNYNNSEPLLKIVTSNLFENMEPIFTYAILEGGDINDRKDELLYNALKYNKKEIIEIIKS